MGKPVCLSGCKSRPYKHSLIKLLAGDLQGRRGILYMGYKGIIVPYPLLTTSKVVEMRFCMREAAWMLGGGLGIGLGFKRGRNVVVSINGGPQHRSQHIIAVIMISSGTTKKLAASLLELSRRVLSYIRVWCIRYGLPHIRILQLEAICCGHTTLKSKGARSNCISLQGFEAHKLKLADCA